MKITIRDVASQVTIGGRDNLLPFDLHKELREYLRVRPKGYRFVKAYQRKQWDGWRYFINAKGVFANGYLPLVIPFLRELGAKIEIEDLRTKLLYLHEERDWVLPQWELTDDQKRCVNAVDNWIEYDEGKRLYFPCGIIDAATNAGKTSFMGGLYQNLTGARTLIMVDRQEIFDQNIEFMQEAFGTDVVGCINPKKYDIKPITVAMAKTLYARLDSTKVQRDIQSYFNVLLVDECHRASGKEYSTVLQNVKAPMRIFVSGTPLDSPDEAANMTVVGLSGVPLIKITKKELMDKGTSLRVNVKMHLNPTVSKASSFNGEQEDVVLYSKERARLIAQTIVDNPGKKVMVAFEFTEHGEFLYEYITNMPEIRTMGVAVEWVHGADRERKDKIKRFKSGETMVLIASTIMQEGVNVKDINILWYALGGKSKIRLSQFSGRLERLDGVSTEAELHDCYDKGKFVSKHSIFRKNFYLKEGFNIDYEYEQKRGKPVEN